MIGKYENIKTDLRKKQKKNGEIDMKLHLTPIICVGRKHCSVSFFFFFFFFFYKNEEIVAGSVV